jgi:hypothetical protein
MNQLFDWIAHRFADSLWKGWGLFCERMMALPEERPALENGKRKVVSNGSK